MITWAEIILAALKLINSILSAVYKQEYINQGYDQAISDMASQIMQKTAAGKAILEKVNALSDADVDAELRGLEPK